MPCEHIEHQPFLWSDLQCVEQATVFVASGNGLERRVFTQAVAGVLPGAEIVVDPAILTSPAGNGVRRYVDLALIALNLPDSDGLDLLERLTATCSIRRSLVVSERFPESAANRMVSGAVDGFFDSRADEATDLSEAVGLVAQGRVYMTYTIPELRHRALEGRKPLNLMLSKTQVLVYYAIADGSNNEAAGELLGMAPDTVKVHRRAIMNAMRYQSRRELYADAEWRGIFRRTNTGRLIRPGFEVARRERDERLAVS